MFAKLTSKNQLTIPKAIADRFPGVEYFDVRSEEDRITLVPVRPGRADEVREQLARYGITEEDVQDAVDWARSNDSPPSDT